MVFSVLLWMLPVVRDLRAMWCCVVEYAETRECASQLRTVIHWRKDFGEATKLAPCQWVVSQAKMWTSFNREAKRFYNYSMTKGHSNCHDSCRLLLSTLGWNESVPCTCSRKCWARQWWLKHLLKPMPKNGSAVNHYSWQLPCCWPTNIFEHDFHISFHPTHAILSRLIPILQVSQVSPVCSATHQRQPQALAAFFPPPPRPAQQRH